MILLIKTEEKNSRFEANLTTERTVFASCLWLDSVKGQCVSCTHAVVAHFLESTLKIYFRLTLGSPPFICPSFRFVTYMALTWPSFPTYWSGVYSIKVFVKLDSDLRLLWAANVSIVNQWSPNKYSSPRK